MESVVFIFSLIDCCALIFLSVYFVSFCSRVGAAPRGVGAAPDGGRALWQLRGAAGGAGPALRRGEAPGGGPGGEVLSSWDARGARWPCGGVRLGRAPGGARCAPRSAARAPRS